MMKPWRGGTSLLLACLSGLALPMAGQGQHVPQLLDSPGDEARGPEGSANEGALFLLLPVGAQAVGVGRAMTSVSTQEAAFWNPAGLAGVDGSRVLLYRGEHLVGDATAISGLVSLGSRGRAALSYQLLDVGSQDLTDAQGNVLGSISVRSHQGIASGAARLSSAVDVGLNLKFVQFGLSCRGQCPEATVSSSTYAVDLGVQASPLEGRPLRLGAMVAHLGPRLHVVDSEKSDPLPSRIRISAGYEVMNHMLPDEGFRLWIRAEVEERWNGSQGDPAVYLGSEFSAGDGDMLHLRGGYILGGATQADAAAVGFGLRYERFELGIARSLARSNLATGSEPVHVTLGIGF